MYRCGMCGNWINKNNPGRLSGTMTSGQGDVFQMMVHYNEYCENGSIPPNVERGYGVPEDYYSVTIR